MRAILLTIFLLSAFLLPAQIVLQIEKYGSPKTQKIGVGTFLEYRLYEYEEWQEGTIEQLIPDENIVVLNDRYIKITDIESIRFDTPQRWSRPLGRNLYLFGASWALYAVVASLVDKEDDYTWGDAAVTGTAAATGFLIQRIFRYKKYHFDYEK